MSRHKRGNPIHGWLVLDKPQGMTSTQAVGLVKRLFRAQKAGHAGTLDPLATGVLPIALGEATKTVPVVMDGFKAYRFTVRWGAETTTDDAEGQVVRTSDLRPTREQIEGLLPRFTGLIEQIPPDFSAVKVEGERAYDLAREGEVLDLAARPVVVERLHLVDSPDAETTVLEADCGKGTYVRALARDLGRALGCFGHVIALRRTEVGPFTEADAVGPDRVRALAEADAESAVTLLSTLLPIEAALEDILAVPVSSADAARLGRGQPVLLRGRDAPIVSGPAYAVSRGRVVAMGEIEKGQLRPTRVFNWGEA
jgi:tRNA pseudouridine55 synthase